MVGVNNNSHNLVWEQYDCPGAGDQLQPVQENHSLENGLNAFKPFLRHWLIAFTVSWCPPDDNWKPVSCNFLPTKQFGHWSFTIFSFKVNQENLNSWFNILCRSGDADDDDDEVLDQFFSSHHRRMLWIVQDVCFQYFKLFAKTWFWNFDEWKQRLCWGSFCDGV